MSIFNPRNDYRHLSFSNLYFRVPHREKFQVFSDTHSLKSRHLCRHIKETPHFKIQCIQGDIIKMCREAATPVVTVYLTSQVTKEQLFPLHHQKKYCLSLYIHDTFLSLLFLSYSCLLSVFSRHLSHSISKDWRLILPGNPITLHEKSKCIFGQCPQSSRNPSQ